MFGFSTLTSTGDWRKDRENLRKAKKELDEVITEAPALAGYLQKKYYEQREQLAPRIMGGAIAEQQQAIQNYQRALKKMGEARVREAARWNIPALQQERQAILAMIEGISKSPSVVFGGPDPVGQLQNLYSELMAGPLERQRATLETFAALSELPWNSLQDIHGQPMRLAVTPLVLEAKGAIPRLRVTDEMVNFDAALRQSRADLAAQEDELLSVGADLGQDVDGPFSGGGVLAKAYRQVKFNQDGSVEIYSPDSPEVSGVVWKNSVAEA